MSANTERIVVARGIPAWHNENSTVLPDDAMDWPTIRRHVPQLGMQVEPKRIMWLDDSNVPHLIPDMVANVREDGTYVGTVGDGYQAVQGEEFYGVLAELLKPNGQGTREVLADTAGTLDGGRKLFIACRASREFMIGNDPHETHRGFLTALNSFDSSTKCGITLSTVRTVCENTFNANLNRHEAAYWFRHTTNIQERIVEARQSLSVAGRYWIEYEKRANELARAKLGPTDWAHVLDTLTQPESKITELPVRAQGNIRREREELTMLWITPDGNFEGTAYKALQAVTAWNDHCHRGRKTTNSVAENRTRRILLDTSLKEKAYSLIAELAEVR